MGRPNSEHALSSISDLAGNVIRLRYDERGLLVEILDVAGRSLQFAYDPYGRILALTAPHPTAAGQRFTVVHYRYDQNGDLAQVIDALGQPASFRYDHHLLVQETDRNGLSFYFVYDARNENARCIRTWGDGGIYDHKLSYDEQLGVTLVENSLGHRTEYTHRDGLVIKTVDALGGMTLTEYNDFNEPVVETDPLEHRTELKYDDRGNLIERKAPDGAKIEISFDAHDRPIFAKDALGGQWSWKYDERGRLVERVNPLGEKTVFEWDRHLTAFTDPAGHRTSLRYDISGALVGLRTPDGAESGWAYDALGRVVVTVDPNSSASATKRSLVRGKRQFHGSSSRRASRRWASWLGGRSSASSRITSARRWGCSMAPARKCGALRSTPMGTCARSGG